MLRTSLRRRHSVQASPRFNIGVEEDIMECGYSLVLFGIRKVGSGVGLVWADGDLMSLNGFLVSVSANGDVGLL